MSAARSSACRAARDLDLAESLGLKQVGGAIIGTITPDSAADHAGLSAVTSSGRSTARPSATSTACAIHVAEAQREPTPGCHRSRRRREDRLGEAR